MPPTLSGIGVVAVSTFEADGTSINEGEYRRLNAWLSSEGASFVVPGAATGEIMQLTEAERRRLLEIAVEAVEGQTAVVAYAGRGSTAETIDALKHAHSLGVTASYVVQPWFSKPDQSGLLAHFAAVAEAVPDAQLILYNNPDRTSVSISHATMQQVVEKYPQFFGIKDADPSSLLDTYALFSSRPDITVWPRSEKELLLALAMGAPGVLSFSGNYLVRELSAIVKSFADGDVLRAREDYYRIFPLIAAAFSKPIPSMVKAIMAAGGWAVGPCRLPILDADPTEVEAYQELLKTTAFGRDLDR